MKGWLGLGLLVTMGCHSESVTVDGNGAVAGAGGDAATSDGVGGDAASSRAVLLEPADGWVSGASNSLGIQGAMFAAGDLLSNDTIVSDFRGSRACMSGAAVQVNLACKPPPGTDCFNIHYGAFMALNLNQRAGTDASEAQPFDVSAITGFTFDVEGPLVPPLVRFELQTDQTDQDPVYCEPTLSYGDTGSGHREVRIEELTQQCYAGGRRGNAVTTVKERALRLRWHVVSNDRGDEPFDFCVTNVHALTD